MYSCALLSIFCPFLSLSLPFSNIFTLVSWMEREHLHRVALFWKRNKNKNKPTSSSSPIIWSKIHTTKRRRKLHCGIPHDILSAAAPLPCPFSFICPTCYYYCYYCLFTLDSRYCSSSLIFLTDLFLLLPGRTPFTGVMPILNNQKLLLYIPTLFFFLSEWTSFFFFLCWWRQTFTGVTQRQKKKKKRKQLDGKKLCVSSCGGSRRRPPKLFSSFSSLDRKKQQQQKKRDAEWTRNPPLSIYKVVFLFSCFF